MSETLRLHLGCRFEYEPAGDVPAICLVRPSGLDGVRLVSERWLTTPAVSYHDYTDMYGNVCRRLTLGKGPAAIEYDAYVEAAGGLDAADPNAPQLPIEALADETIVYTLPSRFCLSDELYDEAFERFGAAGQGYRRVQAVVDYVHETIAFGYGYARPTLTSSDALASRRGVCRDFAHSAIAFCRALSIPARYVFGYLPDIDVQRPDAPMDFCAWFEAYLGGRWWTFDPRNNQRRRGRVVIGRGRDAADVPMVTTYGNANFQGMTCWAEAVGS